MSDPFSRRRFLALSAGGASVLFVGAKAGGVANAATRDLLVAGTRRYDRLEIQLDGLPAVANPFDPAEIDVWVHFVGPTGTQSSVPAFWFQNYTRTQTATGKERLTADGAPGWRARFTPTLPGRWTWHWTAKLPGGQHLHGGRAHVRVGDAHAPGFVRLSPNDRRYLVHDDGSPYFAVGENVGWYDSGKTFDYDRWFGQLAAQSANFARIWMPTWAFALEAPGSPLGDYTSRLDRAWQLDYVFDLAASSGLALMLTLQNHGPFSLAFNSEWAQNPYNAANGGPLQQPQDFFTDATARELFERRTRYCVARWGYAPHLLAWELWNEVDLTGGYDEAVVTSWHQDMAAYVRGIDPNRHLVSTSLAFYPSILTSPDYGTIWNDAGLDFTQVHRYTTVGDGSVVGEADVSRDLPALVQEMLDRHPGPTIVSEYGVNSTSGGGDGGETSALDPDGIALHDALWSAALAGSFGTAMSWWWDTYVDGDPDRFYPMFGAIARFVDGVRWDSEGFTATTAVAQATGRNITVVGLDGGDVRLVWIKNDDNQWNHPDATPVVGATLDLGDSRGWRAAWWDTTTGAPIARTRGRRLPLAIPSFAGDIALRLERVDTALRVPRPR